MISPEFDVCGHFPPQGIVWIARDMRVRLWFLPWVSIRVTALGIRTHRHIVGIELGRKPLLDPGFST